jgi:hypothetical protein
MTLLNSVTRKIFFLCLVSLLARTGVMAQANKDSLLKMMAKDACEEINKMNFDGKDAKTFQVEIGLSILPVINKYEKELKQVYGKDMSTVDILSVAAEDIGMKLALECPAFIKIIADNPGLMMDRIPKNTIYKSVTGKLIKIVPGEFASLLVKKGDGKLVKILWMEAFTGAEALRTWPQQWTGMDVTVFYDEKEMYNGITKKYGKVLIATGIEK